MKSLGQKVRKVKSEILALRVQRVKRVRLGPRAALAQAVQLGQRVRQGQLGRRVKRVKKVKSEPQVVMDRLVQRVKRAKRVKSEILGRQGRQEALEVLVLRGQQGHKVSEAILVALRLDIRSTTRQATLTRLLAK
jgi:hypothetical protein